MVTVKYIRINTSCSLCGKEFVRYKSKTGNYFCNLKCKAKWQVLQREKLGYAREFLIEEYIVKRKSTNQIAREIGRDPKRVWEWLKNYKIKIRPRGTDYGQNFQKGQESAFKGHHHTEEAKEIFRQTQLKHCNLPHFNGKPHYLTIGDVKPASWKGGITPERQAFYSTAEWKDAVKNVWKRDNAICQRCGKRHNTKKDRGTFHIHHIISFMDKEKRCNLENLILLCRDCHLWVHSKKNIDKEFIDE